MIGEDSQGKGERCQATRADGQPCQGLARPSGYCWAHDPELAEARRRGSQLGGQNKARVKRLQRLVPQDLANVFEQLQTALRETHDGDLEPRAASAMASLASAMCKVVELGELAGRLEALEQQVQASLPMNGGKERWPA